MDKTYQTTLLIRGDSKNAVRSVQLTRDELERLTGAQRSGTTATQSFAAAFGKANAAVGNATRSFSSLQGLIAALGIGKLVSETIEAANGYASLQGQLKLVTGSQQELNAVYDRSLALANATGQTTEATVNLYARLARSTEELNLSQDQLFDITEAINQSFIVSGASAQEASSAILQLSQGMASGVLRGEELNSVMENSPRLARALADGLGVSIGQLREMGKEGELTARTVTSALLKTASDIEDEYNEMPLTIARVMQALTNDVNDALGRVDTAPLIGSVSELREVIADPQFKQGITDISGALLDMVAAGAKAATTATGLARFIGEEFAAAINGVSKDDLPRMERELARIENALSSTLFNWIETDKEIARMRKRADELREAIKRANPLLHDFAGSASNAGKATDKTADQVEGLTDSTFEYTKATIDATKAIKEGQKAHERATRQFEQGHKMLDEMVQKSEEYLDQLRFEVLLVGKTEREQAILTAQRKLGAGATQELKDQTRQLSAELFDQKEALKEVEAQTKAAADAQLPFQEALQGTVERIDTAFADAWRGAFDSFSDFADGLKNAFKELLAELAHMAITRPIVMQIGAAVGLGGASGAASAASGLSGAGGLLGLGGSLSGAGASLYTGIGHAATFLGLDDLAVASYGKGMTTSLTSLGLDLGAGLVGGYLGNRAFGGTGVGSLIGGIGGSIFGGPLGAGVGSFLGAGAEKLLGDVFGFGGNGGNNAGRSTFNLGTGLNNAVGIGNNFDQANVDTAQALVNTLQAFANTLGGSDFAGSVKVGNRSGIKLDGKKFDSPEEFFQATFQAIIDGATNLDEPLRSLISNFEGSAEEIMQFSAAVLSLNDAAGINTVTQAIEDFNAVQPTVLQAYLDNTVAVWDMVRGFDGSAGAASQLNDALLTNKAAAYEFALAIQSIGAELKAMGADQAKSIRESVLSEEELRAVRREERNTLRESLSTLTDPQEIEAATKRILELNKLIFDSLDEDLQAERAESFATYAENTSLIANKILDRTLRELEATQESLNSAVSTLLQSAASAQQNAANTQVQAANQFAAWVARLTSQGITVNITQTAPEVNV